MRIPEEESDDIKLGARGIQCWGQVPVLVRIRSVDFRTALFPRTADLIPLKNAVCKPIGLELDDVVTVPAGHARGREGAQRAGGQARSGRV